MSEKKKDVARRWVNEPLRALFDAEIRNEDEGGVRPATLSSTIDSVVQMPDDVLSGITDEDVVGALASLLAIRDMLPGKTPVEELLA